MHLLIRLSHDAQVRVLERHWAQYRPDLVVSLIPHYNRALKEALDRAWPAQPFVTVLTDIADYPPHFWIERLDQYVICGSERAAGQARQLGIPGASHPADLRHDSATRSSTRRWIVDRRGERMRLGLEPDRPTGLVLFGGEGSTRDGEDRASAQPPR